MAKHLRGGMLKNRILGREDVAPDQLLANPFNAWKIHPGEQQDEVLKVLETIGWVKDVIVNKRTGHMVDGHLRVGLALSRGEETVPVSYIDVSPEEEKLLLAVLDPLASMSGRDNEELDKLLVDVTASFGDSDIDLNLILARDKKVSKGLTHEVHECTCCDKKCKKGCGCYRETEKRGKKR